MNIPFTSNWICSKCNSYCKDLNVKGTNYRIIRDKIQNLCRFFIFKIPKNNIIVLKNYYSKNTIIICVRPIFGFGSCVFIKTKKYYRKYISIKKNFNVFEEYKNGIK